MKFDFRRLTPALVTSLALLFLALLCASIGWVILAWIVGLAGLALNVIAVAVVEIDVPMESSRTTNDRKARSTTTTVRSNPSEDRAKDARTALRDSAARTGRISGPAADSAASSKSASDARASKDSGSDSPVRTGSTSTSVSSSTPTSPSASASTSSVTGDTAAVGEPKITKRF